MRQFIVGPEFTGTIYGPCKKVILDVAGVQTDILLLMMKRVRDAKTILGRTDQSIANSLRREMDLSLLKIGQPIIEDLEFITVFTELFH